MAGYYGGATEGILSIGKQMTDFGMKGMFVEEERAARAAEEAARQKYHTGERIAGQEHAKEVAQQAVTNAKELKQIPQAQTPEQAELTRAQTEATKRKLGEESVGAEKAKQELSDAKTKAAKQAEIDKLRQEYTRNISLASRAAASEKAGFQGKADVARNKLAALDPDFISKMEGNIKTETVADEFGGEKKKDVSTPGLLGNGNAQRTTVSVPYQEYFKK